MSLWNDLDDPVFDGLGLTGFKSRANRPYFCLLLFSLFLPTIGRCVWLEYSD